MPAPSSSRPAPPPTANPECAILAPPRRPAPTGRPVERGCHPPEAPSTILTTQTHLTAAVAGPTWRHYLELTKPKVVALIVFAAIVGTLLASPGWPPLDALVWGNLGI